MNMQSPAVQGGLVVGSIATVVKAFIVLGRSLGWWDDAAVKALVDFFDIAIPALSTVAIAWWMSRKTISKEDPRDTDGEKLVRKDTHGPTLYEEKKDLERSIKR